jgi:hypothetical protein
MTDIIEAGIRECDVVATTLLHFLFRAERVQVIFSG